MTLFVSVLDHQVEINGKLFIYQSDNTGVRPSCVFAEDNLDLLKLAAVEDIFVPQRDPVKA